MREKPIVAIDGPAGVGKSTVARAVAKRLGYRYLNTGSMYRAVAWRALETGAPIGDPEHMAEIARALRISFEDQEQGERVWVDGRDVTEALTSPEVSEASSIVSAHPPVRRELVKRQRSLGERGGVVMEGRDIGTVVFPDAEVKVFLSATLQERAQRRYAELRDRGVDVDFAALRAAEEARDERDRVRPHSPLKVAADAVLIDTSEKAPEQVVEEVLALARRASR